MGPGWPRYATAPYILSSLLSWEDTICYRQNLFGESTSCADHTNACIKSLVKQFLIYVGRKREREREGQGISGLDLRYDFEWNLNEKHFLRYKRKKKKLFIFLLLSWFQQIHWACCCLQINASRVTGLPRRKKRELRFFAELIWFLTSIAILYWKDSLMLSPCSKI